MWDLVELREIRVFLVLADELHFGRTAERVGLTQSRVSQSLRALEHKLGVQLFHRTSRSVRLTAAGEALRDELATPYGRLTDVLRETHDAHRDVQGTLRLGAHNVTTIGDAMLAAVAAFEAAHPACAVRVVDVSSGDRLETLKLGRVDLMVTHLPVEDRDLVVGPVIEREGRLLAVARDHPLAGRAAVGLEDIAGYDVGWPDRLLPETSEAWLPSQTPSGRPIRRVRLGIADFGELIVAVARGTIVHPTLTSFAARYGHPNVRYVPIEDLPPAETALVWRRQNANAAVREFARFASEALD